MTVSNHCLCVSNPRCLRISWKSPLAASASRTSGSIAGDLIDISNESRDHTHHSFFFALYARKQVPKREMLARFVRFRQPGA